LVIVGEVYWLAGASLFSTLLEISLPGKAINDFRRILIGFVIVFAAISISFDIWMVVLSGREIRRQRRELAER
jgi:hypothetical protein